MSQQKFINADPAHAHILLKEHPDPELFALLEQVCPAGLYWHDNAGYHYNYGGCLECGACRILGNENVYLVWNYPNPPYGVNYVAE